MTADEVRPFKPKLIRNKVPLAIRLDGLIPRTRVVSGAEFRRFLREKLCEEVEEYLDSDNPAELIDIMEVVLALGDTHNLSPQQLEQQRVNKVAERGSFSLKIVWMGNLPTIETIEVPEDLL